MPEGTAHERAVKHVRDNFEEVHDTAPKETAFLQRRRGPNWGGFGEGKLRKPYRVSESDDVRQST